MTSGQRGGLAIVFVAAIGLTLAMPVIDADDTAPTGGTALPTAGTPEPTEEPEPEPTEEPEPEPTEEPEPEPTEPEEPGPPIELTAEVPEECFQAQPLPSPGSVVTIARSEVRWVSLDSGDEASFPTGGDRLAPVSFSPSGTYVAFGVGTIGTSDGATAEQIAGVLPTVHAWSPQSDCLYAIDTAGVLWVHAALDSSERLLEGSFTSFAVAPSGDRIALFADDSVTVYDLRSGDLIGEQAAVPNPSTPLLWQGKRLYYGTPSEDGMDVGALRVGGRGARPRNVDYDVVLPSSLVACGDRVLAVSAEGLLVDLETGSSLADDGFEYGSASCDPGGSFIAATRWERGQSPFASRLVALDPQGNFVSDIGAGDGAEILPEWGPPGTGVVFISLPTRRGPGDLIYAQESGGTTLSVKVGRLRGFDWSATAPTGIPALSF